MQAHGSKRTPEGTLPDFTSDSIIAGTRVDDLCCGVTRVGSLDRLAVALNWRTDPLGHVISTTTWPEHY